MTTLAELAIEIVRLTPVELDGLRADLGLPPKNAIYSMDLKETAIRMLEVYSPGDALAQIQRRTQES